MPMSTKEKSNYFWSSLLCLTIAFCILLLYISEAHKGTSGDNAVISDQRAAQSEKLTDDDECPPVCITKECLSHSNLLITNMKSNVDPCENFYSYACGNYDKKFGEDEVDSIITRNHRRMVNALRDVLDKIEAIPGTSSWKLKAVYDSCMKVDSENEALTDALNFLSELGIGPDWPDLTPDFKFQNTNISIILGKLLAYDECPIMRIKMDKVNTKTSDQLQKIITIVNNQKLFSERARPPPVREMFLSILEEFGLSSEDFETTQEIWKEFFSIHLAMHRLHYRSTSVGSNAIGIQVDCSEGHPQWEYFCEVFESFMKETATVNEGFDKNHVNIEPFDIHFMSHIVPQLNQFTDRAIANYLAIHFFWTHGMDLSFPFRLKNWKHSLKEDPFQPPKFSRWEYCINWLAENMYVALGYEFTKKVLPKEAFDEIIAIVDEFVGEIVNLIREQDWTSEHVKEAITDEIGNITSSLRFTKKLFFNETIINEAYKEFNFTNRNYFKNLLQHRCFSIMKTEELFKDFLQIPETPFEANAEASAHGIDIHFGMLFPPTYLHGLERFINLISLGNIIAHEIGHHVYFEYEKLEDEADNRTYVDFEERRTCLKNKYSRFKFDSLDIFLPGEKYTVEAFPDGVAIAVIDKMIEKYASSELSLPGLPYSTEQLLYLSVAQFWCSKTSTEEDEFYFTKKNHPPSRFRVIAQMQGSKNFARAFNCSKGSYMNPENKCLVFD